MKRALICGISGQDGAYLTQLLLKEGYEVFGTSRDAQLAIFPSLEALGVREQVKTYSMALNDFRSVLQVINKVQPDEIYNLAGQTSVGLSFELPVETMDSITLGTLNLLEAIRFTGAPIKFYNAGSSESFGDTGAHSADEETPSVLAALMPWRKRRRFGNWLTTGKPTIYLPALAFCLTMTRP